jgi:hypothetical protein
MHGDCRQGRGMEFALSILSASIIISVLSNSLWPSISRPGEAGDRRKGLGMAFGHTSFSPPLSSSLSFSLSVCFTLFPSILLPLSVYTL